MSLIIKDIVIADNNHIARLGLRKLLEDQQDMRITGEAEDGQQAVKLTKELKPDVAIFDLMLPGINGLQATAQIKKLLPKTHVVILSMYKNDSYVTEALKKGAEGYVLKDTAGTHIVDAIRAVAARRLFLSPPLSDFGIENYLKAAGPGKSSLYDTLTNREREIFLMSAEGLGSAQIAERLKISCRTVEVHRLNMMHKLGLRNEVELVRYAIQKGIMLLDN